MHLVANAMVILETLLIVFGEEVESFNDWTGDTIKKWTNSCELNVRV